MTVKDTAVQSEDAASAPSLRKLCDMGEKAISRIAEGSGVGTFVALRLHVDAWRWRIVDDVVGSSTPPHAYEPGTWGPPEAATVLRPGDRWHDPVERPAVDR